MKRTVGIVAVAAAMMVAGCGGTGPEPAAAEPAPAVQGLLEAAPVPAATTSEPAGKAPAKTETKTVVETKRIAYKTRTVEDPDLAVGVKKTKVKGVAGVRTLTYKVTFTGGRQTAKKLMSEKVKQPVTKVVAVGTEQGGGCDPNYSGECVPVASDVDCAGGSGNGPEYVRGPVEVVGSDVYDLDRDGDGTACD